jgi:hypothetical protein
VAAMASVAWDRCAAWFVSLHLLEHTRCCCCYGSSLSSSLAVQAAQPRRRLRQQVVEDDESDTEAEVDASACITATAPAAAAEQRAPLGAQLGKRVRKPPKQFADHMLYDEGNAAAATAEGR